MKPPPILLGAALLFWGWQAEFFIAGAVMAVILEGARLVKIRWELSDDDFRRVWTFCALLFLASTVYAFTSNDGPANFGSFFQNPNIRTQGGAGLSAARAGAAMLRWIPMIFFPFMAAQVFATRDTIPLSTISLIVRRRRRQAQLAGQVVPPSRNMNVGYPFFGATLMAASIQPSQNTSYFWGLCALLTWALWAQRSRRFGIAVWFGALIAAVLLGFAGQRGLNHLQTYLEKMNFSWLARFQRRDTDPLQSKTALGRIGRLKLSGQIVIRVQPVEGKFVPTYLREATYRMYRPGAVWSAGNAREDYQTVGEDPPNSGTWNILPGKSNAFALRIACYLEGSKSNAPAGLLPLPTGVGRLEQLPAFVLERNDSSGTVLAQGPSLVIFNACYEPGPTFDSPPGTVGFTNRVRRTMFANTNESPFIATQDTRPAYVLGSGSLRTRSPTNEDLAVPDNEVPALDAIIDQMNLRDERDQSKILKTVAAFFTGDYTYSTWQDPSRLQTTNDTYISRFLLESRAGHCEYFASATTLVLRRLNIPARYAVGYVIHENSGDGYVVRLRDAHAWCLVWNEQRKVWFDFDTTPASWIEAENANKSPFQWLSDFWTRVGFELSKLKLRWTQGKLQPYVIWLLVPVLGFILYRFFRRGRRRRKVGAGAEEIFDWPGLDSEFYQLEKQLAARGVERGDSELMSEWLRRVAETPSLAELRAPLEEILRLHYRYRFDPVGLNATDRETLRREVRACLEKLSQVELVAAGK